MNKKMGWTVSGILGMVFAPMGLLFVLIGAVVWKSNIFPSQHPDVPVIFFSVFGGVGGIFLILGLAFLLWDIRRRHLLRMAYESGNCVEAEIIGVSTVNNVKTHGRFPRVIECAYTDPSGVVHIYRSRYLNIDVSGLLKTDKVPVYIDRYNEKIGFVDIDAVLPEIRIHS